LARTRPPVQSNDRSQPAGQLGSTRPVRSRQLALAQKVDSSRFNNRTSKPVTNSRHLPSLYGSHRRTKFLAPVVAWASSSAPWSRGFGSPRDVVADAQCYAANLQARPALSCSGVSRRIMPSFRQQRTAWELVAGVGKHWLNWCGVLSRGARDYVGQIGTHRCHNTIAVRVQKPSPSRAPGATGPRAICDGRRAAGNAPKRCLCIGHLNQTRAGASAGPQTNLAPEPLHIEASSLESVHVPKPIGCGSASFGAAALQRGWRRPACRFVHWIVPSKTPVAGAEPIP